MKCTSNDTESAPKVKNAHFHKSTIVKEKCETTDLYVTLYCHLFRTLSETFNL